MNRRSEILEFLKEQKFIELKEIWGMKDEGFWRMTPPGTEEVIHALIVELKKVCKQKKESEDWL